LKYFYALCTKCIWGRKVGRNLWTRQWTYKIIRSLQVSWPAWSLSIVSASHNVVFFSTEIYSECFGKAVRPQSLRRLYLQALPAPCECSACLSSFPLIIESDRRRSRAMKQNRKGLLTHLHLNKYYNPVVGATNSVTVFRWAHRLCNT
jgi:hypothetical protein